MNAELPSILLVDDEKDNLEALKRLLRREFNVEAFLSGEEAIEHVKKSSTTWDAVVSDQRMPGMSGSEFFEKLQEINPSPTRILLTGFADLEAIIDAVNRGHIWRYIAKPWEPDDLKLTLKQAVERTRMQQSLRDSNLSLEKALQSLKAKDWARERLLKILLHEFRTIPQILNSVVELDQGPDARSDESKSAKKNFVVGVSTRVNNLAREIEDLFNDEIKIAKLQHDKFLISSLVNIEAVSDESYFSGPQSEIKECLQLIIQALEKNNHKVPVKLGIDSVRGSKGGTVFLSFHLDGPSQLLPVGLIQQNLSPELAWPALLEPFVGLDDFQHHSTGLRHDFL